MRQDNPVSAIFHRREDAEAALERLHAAGFAEIATNLIYAERATLGARITPSGERVEYIEDDDVRPGGGAAAGAITGGLIGLAAGPIGAALGAIGGAVVGGLAAGMIHLGYGEHDARWFDEQVRQGRTLVSVNAGSRAMLARDILADAGGTLRSTQDSLV